MTPFETGLLLSVVGLAGTAIGRLWSDRSAVTKEQCKSQHNGDRRFNENEFAHIRNELSWIKNKMNGRTQDELR